MACRILISLWRGEPGMASAASKTGKLFDMSQKSHGRINAVEDDFLLNDQLLKELLVDAVPLTTGHFAIRLTILTRAPQKYLDSEPLNFQQLCFQPSFKLPEYI
uniref:Uncharacterized protein n=1 Tax=Romanomermis culicivorax TaxID=13658 RepID=A0A915JR75_ROMCU